MRLLASASATGSASASPEALRLADLGGNAGILEGYAGCDNCRDMVEKVILRCGPSQREDKREGRGAELWMCGVSVEWEAQGGADYLSAGKQLVA